MNDWKETTLGEVCCLITDGKHGDCTNENNSGYFFISAKDIFNGKINYKEARQITRQDFEETDRRTNLQIGDILITNSGTIGRIALVSDNENVRKTTFQKSVAILKPLQDEIISKYLYYYLFAYNRQIVGTAGGTTQQNLLLGDLRRFEIKIHQVNEQKAIAAVLSSFDDKIELLRQQNQTLEKIAQTIFKEWFVNFKINGKKLKIDKLTGLPEGWRMGKLSDEVEIIMGQSPPGASYNESGQGMIFFQGRAEFRERFPIIRLYTTEPKRIAEKFDVLVSVRAPVGDINVAFDKCCIGRGLGAVRGKDKSYTLYKIKSLKDAFNKFEADGTVFGSIGKDAFANIETTIPDSETVKTFEAIARVIDGKIFINYSQIQTLTKLRDTLLPKLMKGEIRVTKSYK